MTLKFIYALIGASLIYVVQAGESQPPAVIHIDHAKVAAGGTLLQTRPVIVGGRQPTSSRWWLHRLFLPR